MPANFRKSGKRYKSKKGLVKYQDRGALDYFADSATFSPPMTRDSILRAREDSLTGINYNRKLEQLQNMMYGKNAWNWLQNRLQNPKWGARMDTARFNRITRGNEQAIQRKTYYGGGEPIKIQKKIGPYDSGVAFRKGGSCRFGCGTGPNGIL